MSKRVKLLMAKYASWGSEEGTVQHLEELINQWIEGNQDRTVESIVMHTDSGKALYAMIIHRQASGQRHRNNDEPEDHEGIARPEEVEERYQRIRKKPLATE
ncbi:MAG: hypothetical protein ACOY93_08480 [Bacillota bacterium]